MNRYCRLILRQHIALQAFIVLSWNLTLVKKRSFGYLWYRPFARYCKNDLLDAAFENCKTTSFQKRSKYLMQMILDPTGKTLDGKIQISTIFHP